MAVQGAALREVQAPPTQRPQLHVLPADHSVGVAFAVSVPTLHQELLRQVRDLSPLVEFAEQAETRRPDILCLSERTHGLTQAIRLASQQPDLQFIAQRLETEGGTKKLKRLLANAFPKEDRSKA